MISITNHGPLITATDYWGSGYAASGKMILSPNAGAIRCLMPPVMYAILGELRQCPYAIVTRGLWNGQEAIEILWEDHSDCPVVWHLTAESCLMLPGDPGADKWLISCWVQRRGMPHKAIERPCHWRRTDTLPYMHPLEERSNGHYI